MALPLCCEIDLVLCRILPPPPVLLSENPRKEPMFPLSGTQGLRPNHYPSTLI